MPHLPEQPKKHRAVCLAALAACAVLALAVLIWLGEVRPNAGKSRTEKISDSYTASTVLQDGQTVSQVFTYDDDILAVLLEFEIPGAQPTGTIEVLLSDADTGEELARSTGVMANVLPGQYSTLGLDRTVEGQSGRRYRLDVTARYDAASPGTLAVGHSSGVTLWAEQMQVDGTAVDATLALWVACQRIGGFLTRFFLLVSLAAAALVFLGVWYALAERRPPLHRMAFALVLGFGLLYGLVLPPYSAPDEKYHINQSFTLACRWANLLSDDEWHMGHVATTTSYRRETDFDTLLQDENTTVFSWAQFVSRLPTTTDAAFDSHTELDELQTDQNPLLYLASAAAVFLGYVLHLGFTPTLALGRLANLLLFAALAALAVKHAPFGKRVYLTAALLPMTLHLACSFSRDAPLLGLCFAFSALIFEAVYEPDKAPLRPARGAALALLGVLAASGKLVYLPLAALFLLLPAARLGRAPRAKKCAYLAVCAVLALALNQGALLNAVSADAAQETAAAETDADAAEADRGRPEPADPDYEETIRENTLENFVRRLYYYGADDAAPAQAEVDFWVQALAEGDVSPAALGQTFLLDADYLASEQPNDTDFVSAATLCFLDLDALSVGDTEFLDVQIEQGSVVAYKAVYNHAVAVEILAALGLEHGDMDDRLPLDRAILAAEVEAARATRDSQSVANEADSVCYTPGYILRHLPDTVLLLVRTAVENTDRYLCTLVGGSLSYYSVDLAWGWVAILYLLLAFAAVPAAGDTLPGGAPRVWGALAALGCALLVLAGCVLWTPTYYTTVYGLQGRYFLPVLPLLLLTCLPRNALRVQGGEERAAGGLAAALCVMQAGVLCNIMLSIIAK